MRPGVYLLFRDGKLKMEIEAEKSDFATDSSPKTDIFVNEYSSRDLKRKKWEELVKSKSLFSPLSVDYVTACTEK